MLRRGKQRSVVAVIHLIWDKCQKGVNGNQAFGRRELVDYTARVVVVLEADFFVGWSRAYPESEDTWV